MAYEYESELEEEFEEEFEGEGEEEMEDESGLEGEGWLGTIGNVVGSLLGEGEGEEEYEDESAFEGEGELEDEGEGEDEFESEEELSPIRRIYPDAMMEHLGELAFEAESEDEAAEHFLPLIGLAASKILPAVAKVGKISKTLSKVGGSAKLAKAGNVARAVSRSAPHLTKGIGKVARLLHRDPKTRHLVKVVPAIARRAVGSIARQAAHGRRFTPKAAVHALAKQARHVLGHPLHRKHALRRHNHLERKLHGRHAGVARAHGHIGRGVRWHGRYPRGHRLYGRRPRGYGYRYGAGGAPVGGSAGRVSAGAVPGAVRPGYRAPAAGGVSQGRVVGGQCVCGAAQGAATPAYCRCCGQVIR